jgi:hypothetical protein
VNGTSGLFGGFVTASLARFDLLLHPTNNCCLSMVIAGRNTAYWSRLLLNNMIYSSSSFSAISLPGMGSFKINSYDIVHKSGVSLSIARVAYDCVVQTSLAGTS